MQRLSPAHGSLIIQVNIPAVRKAESQRVLIVLAKIHQSVHFLGGHVAGVQGGPGGILHLGTGGADPVIRPMPRSILAGISARQRPVAITSLTPAFCTVRRASTFSLGTRGSPWRRRVRQYLKQAKWQAWQVLLNIWFGFFYYIKSAPKV